MGLASAHEGYEYQDLLTTYFILAEILTDSSAVFYIDRKEFANDKVDDLRVVNKDGVVKRQVKYSNSETDHTFTKSNISAESSYQLSVDSLYHSWLEQPDKDITELRLCLAWNEPVDDLKKFLEPLSGEGSFNGFATKQFILNAETIWPEGGQPDARWHRLRSLASTIDRRLFGEFCRHLAIEVELPKFSLNLTKPGELEKLVLAQTKKIGIGVFPNHHLHVAEFIHGVMAIVKRARSRMGRIDVVDIFHELNIKVDFGRIEQKFPVVEAENIKHAERITKFISAHENDDRVILTGEPGSGKSWFIENLHKYLEEQKVRVVRHYCYTQLDDILQKERIKINTFYGNLIFDILKAFPELSSKKEEKFASNISELNILLSSIKEPTWLIIDGLDHIERIFHFRKYNDIAVDETAIINNIQKLIKSPHVKILVASQNIPQLTELSGFVRASIDPWTIDDIKELLTIQNIADISVETGVLLSDFLLKKSEGNPLYIRYILEEANRDVNALLALPPYSYNLQEYYQYLISQLNQQEDVPQVLSGVNFSLDVKEIIEITQAGDFVESSLRTLGPILKTSLTQTGYIIYHESFRRFMIDRLKERNVSVERKVFFPVIEWFDSKNLFAYNKAYRYCLPYYYESGHFEKIIQRLNYKFVTDSVVHGYPWLLIKFNYRYFVKAACQLKDFRNVVLLNEINKIIDSTYNEFKSNFHLYIKVVGSIHGFDHVSSLLSFEDGQFFSIEEGLEACSICDDHKAAAPWHLFMNRIIKGSEIEIEWFPFWIRGLLVTRNTKALLDNAKQLGKDKSGRYETCFRAELTSFYDKDYVVSLSTESKYISKMIRSKIDADQQQGALDLMIDDLIELEDVFEEASSLISSFFERLRATDISPQIMTQIIETFKGRNWFFNWLIYYSKIIALTKKVDPAYEEIKAAFDYLKYSTEPFLGKPRTCDLYQIHNYIQTSIRQGLDLLDTNTCDWDEILDILVTVSNNTTTTLQRSPNGPLETTVLIRILGDYSDNRNAQQFQTEIEKIIEDKKKDRLHSDIADYWYLLALFHNKAGDKTAAIDAFRNAVEYALSYTMRKDQTLDDAIHGLESISIVAKDKAISEAMKVRILVESVVDHTDGKGTQYYPITWFKSLLNVDVHKSSLYLLNAFLNSRFDWRGEKSLVDLLTAKGLPVIDSVIHFYLSMSMPTNHTDDLNQYRLDLYDELRKIDTGFAEKLLAIIEPAMQPKQNHHISDAAVDRFNKIVIRGDVDLGLTAVAKEKSKSSDLYEQNKVPLDFATMAGEDILAFVRDESSRLDDISPLITYLQSQAELTEQLKEIIRLSVRNGYRLFTSGNNLPAEFNNPQIACFYWVCRYVYDTGDWFERLVNFDALFKAHTIDTKLTEEFLFSQLPYILDAGFNFQFSSNLLKGLVMMKAEPETIKDIWKIISEVTTYRLPIRKDIDWMEYLKDDQDMTTEEVFMCIVISRFRTASTERTQYVVSAVSYFMDTNPALLVKPFKWFFRNRLMFLECIQAIILQFLLQDKEKGGSLHHLFTDIFREMLLQNHYLLDFLLSKLLDEPMPIVEAPSDLVYPSLPEDELSFFINLNRRYKLLADYGLNMDQVFSKYINTAKTKFNGLLNLYLNNYPKSFLSNLYPANYMLELVNKNHYNVIKDIVDFEDENVGQYMAFINLECILAQVNSLGLRPKDLAKPSEASETYASQPPNITHAWIRLGHYEMENKHERDLSHEYNSMGGIIFSDDVADADLFPYNDYYSHPFLLLGTQIPLFNTQKRIVCHILQDDSLEFCKILWLNPVLVSQLGLTTKHTHTGLVADNSDGEQVLKLRTWYADYIGDDNRSALSEMIPRLQGSELIIRKDYFEKLSALFGAKGSYRTVTLKPNRLSVD